MTTTNFQANLKKLMEEQGLTQAKLGEKMNTTQQTIGKYCTGKALPNLDTAVLIAKALNVSLDALVGIDNTTIKESDNEYLFADLLRELVLIFDTLCFDVSITNSSFSEKHLGFEYEETQMEVILFWEKWAKYRELLQNGDIQQEDYNVLVNARLNELPPLKVEKAEMLKKYVSILHENRLHRSK